MKKFPGIRRMMIVASGLKTAPEITGNEMVVRIAGDVVDLEFQYKTAVEREGVYTIKL